MRIDIEPARLSPFRLPELTKAISHVRSIPASLPLTPALYLVPGRSDAEVGAGADERQGSDAGARQEPPAGTYVRAQERTNVKKRWGIGEKLPRHACSKARKHGESCVHDGLLLFFLSPLVHVGVLTIGNYKCTLSPVKCMLRDKQHLAS